MSIPLPVSVQRPSMLKKESISPNNQACVPTNPCPCPPFPFPNVECDALYLTTSHRHLESRDKNPSPLDSEVPPLSNQSSPSPSPGPSPPAPVGLGLGCHGSFSDQNSSFYSNGAAAEEVLVRGAAPEHEIECALDTMTSIHLLEYEGDMRKLKLEDQLSRQPSPPGRLWPRAADGSSPVISEESFGTRLVDIDRYRGSASGRQHLQNLQTRSSGDSSGSTTQTSTPRVPERARQDPNGDETGFCTDGRGGSLVQGVADRLFGHGFHTRSRSQSGPPIMERAGVLDRSPAFQTEPSGTSFACIFAVRLPQDGNTGAPLSRLGRPLVPDAIATDRLTVVATYHPSYRYLVVDVLDYCHCPAGFESTQIADLIYMQNNGYMPPYCIWPMQSYSPERYQVTPQWSLCTTNANGLDVLYVSDINVLVQRVAGCMYRVNEARHMSKSAHRRYMDSISQSCSEVCQVELFSKVSGLSPEPMCATVSMDFYRSAALEWVILGAQPSHQLPHSRFGIPVRPR